MFTSSFPTVCNEKFYVRSVYPEIYKVIVEFRNDVMRLDNAIGPHLPQRARNSNNRNAQNWEVNYVANRLKEAGISVVITLQMTSFDNNFKVLDYNSLKLNVLTDYSVVHLIDPNMGTN